MKTRVVHGRTRSCGCLAHKNDHSRTHGMRGTKEYRTWGGMKTRCYNKRSKDYYRYGGKGISIYQPWRDSFEEFYKYIGPAPTKNHQIDRINTMGNYEPGNVRWATPKIQCRNRSVSYEWYIQGNKFESAKEAGSFFGVKEQTVHKWVKGYFDKRRGTYREPKKDCFVVEKYSRGSK
jgi:hypothetical protein